MRGQAEGSGSNTPAHHQKKSRDGGMECREYCVVFSHNSTKKTCFFSTVHLRQDQSPGVLCSKVQLNMKSDSKVSWVYRLQSKSIFAEWSHSLGVEMSSSNPAQHSPCPLRPPCPTRLLLPKCHIESYKKIKAIRVVWCLEAAWSLGESRQNIIHFSPQRLSWPCVSLA